MENIRHFINIIESVQKPNINPAFWQWFGNSEVIDDSGNPLPVYHGSTGNINKFDLRGRSRTGGKAYFFSTDSNFASAYASKGGDESGSVYPVYLRIVNPFHYTNTTHLKTLEREVESFLKHEKETKPYGKAEDFYPFTKSKIFDSIAQGKWNAIEHPIIIDALKKSGFDGAIMYEGQIRNFMVFSPRQIKSVFNRGTWSPSTSEIDK